LKFEPSLDVDWPNIGSQLGLLSDNVTDEAFKSLFEVVVDLNLLGIGDRDDLELIGQLTSPAQSVVLEIDVVLVDFVFCFDEKENSGSEGVDLKHKSMEQVSVDQVVIMPSDNVVTSFDQEVDGLILLVQVVSTSIQSVVFL
jgi:hypothetical protein